MRICDACRVQMTSHGKRNFAQNLKTSVNISLFGLPISVIFATFFAPFPNKWPQGSRATPKSDQKTPKWTPRVPKWSPRVPQWSPKVTPNPQKAAQICPKEAKWTPGFHNGAPRSHQGLKRHHEALQNATKTPKYSPRCQKNDIPTNRHISSKIHGIFFKGRRQCFAHQ